MEQMKTCYNVNLVVLSQCNFHHSTILGMPDSEDTAVDQPPEGTEAIPARASLEPFQEKNAID